MLWIATKLRREPRLNNPTIIIVTDRTQLDTQITRTFERTGFPAPEHANTTRQLRQYLTTGAGRTVMTTIQKFEEALETPRGEIETLNEADNVFVMVDEAHRTQYGLLGAKMTKALPKATFVGFTGTPIDRGFNRSTMKRFGPLIDKYTIPQSVADGATVPIYYEARLPELAIQGPNTLDKLFDAIFKDETPEMRERIRRRYANKETLATAPKRIEAIAFDIYQHFDKYVRPNGFKAQVVAPNRETACLYADKLSSFGVNAFPIITTTPEDRGRPEFARALEIDQGQIINEFVNPEGNVEILVVVDMLLTGFDAPVEQLLYLDRSLREHGLLQAIARVNRPFRQIRNGAESVKGYGLVVDYHGVSKELYLALQEFDKADLDGTMLPLEADPSHVIEATARQAASYFKNLDLDDVWRCVLVFEDRDADEGYRVDLLEQFNADYRDFASTLDRYLPDPKALPYVDRLLQLTRIRNYARAQFARVDSTVDWTDVSAKVKNLIDSRIDAEVRELMKPVSILDQDFEAKISSLPHDEARASMMEHAIRAQIKERLEENPALYERLSQQLERIIEEMRRRLIDAAEAVKRFRTLQLAIEEEGESAARLGMSEVSLAVYDLLDSAVNGGLGQDRAGRVREEGAPYRTHLDDALKAVALGIEAAIKEGQRIVDWKSREDVQRVMRRDIKRELRRVGGFPEEELDELARSMVEIARHRSS
jgi:type I restriction enzyme R subunit